MASSPSVVSGPSTADELVMRRARALVQHQQVMEEAAEVARLNAQARRRSAATPVFADGRATDSFRARVHWQAIGDRMTG